MTTSTDHTLERVTDELAYRFEATFTRDEVVAAVQRARAELEPTSRHPEFLPVLVERAAKQHLTSQARRRGDAPGMMEILFVCQYNEGRSQMAAALTEHLSEGRVHVRSAGATPTGLLNPMVVDALAERGVELDHPFPTPVENDVLAAADVVVQMSPGLPTMPGRRHVSWDVEDPHHRSLEAVRAIREDIEARVIDLLTDLGVRVSPDATRPTRPVTEIRARSRRDVTAGAHPRLRLPMGSAATA